MLRSFIQKFVTIVLLTTSLSLPAFAAEAYSVDSQKTERAFIENIEQTPLILGNYVLSYNSLQGSVYELLNHAQHSILILSFTFSDPEVIRIVNQKASEGIHVQLIIDRDHLSNFNGQLHPSIQIGTRAKGEGHLHHKILVIDHEYIWLGSANFTQSAFTHSKNLAIAFFSPEIGAQLYQEALAISSSLPRVSTTPLSCLFGNQRLELYLLPHNAPEAPYLTETKMNEIGKQKLISLLDNAKHHIKISVDVWTFKDASRAVINAMKRGVKVDVVVGNTTDEAVKMIIQSGIKVKLGKNLHYKFMLVDHEILLNGSPNWSMNAFSRSDESFIVLHDLTEHQLKALEGTLEAAGLPIPMSINEMEASSINDFSEEELHAKIELINRTITALNHEINTAPASQENQRLVAIAKRLAADLVKFIPYMTSAPVPGCCLYEGDNYLANVIAIAEKQEKVESAIKYIKIAKGIDQKVHDYFQKTLKKLQSGINAPLPDYFHATREGLESIIKSQNILQSKTGVTGPGTYVSCNNEGNHGYGTHAFAIDEECLVDTHATFRTGRHPITNVFFSLWASVLMDIPVTEESIAFIDTSTDDIPYVQALLEEQHLNIEVVDRNTAENILRIFDLTTKRRELPSFFWEKFNSQDYLPQNMYPRSPQGNFRHFMFSS